MKEFEWTHDDWDNKVADFKEGGVNYFETFI